MSWSTLISPTKNQKKKSFRSRDTWNVDVGWAVMEKVREDCITAQLSHEIITKCFPSPGLSSETFLFVFCVNNKKNYYQPWLVITKILFAPNQIAHQSCTASHKKNVIRVALSVSCRAPIHCWLSRHSFHIASCATFCLSFHVRETEWAQNISLSEL